MALLLIHTTLDNEARAHELARVLITRHLAACASVGAPVISHYIWQGKPEETREYPLTLKTTSERAVEVKAFLREHHPYDVPEILVQKIDDADADYAAWVREQTDSGNMQG